VKILLLSGADATIRTRSGALPYHLAGLQHLRSMLGDMGGPGAIPAEGDVVDMVSILRELTMPESYQMMSSMSTNPEGEYFVMCPMLLPCPECSLQLPKGADEFSKSLTTSFLHITRTLFYCFIVHVIYLYIQGSVVVEYRFGQDNGPKTSTTSSGAASSGSFGELGGSSSEERDRRGGGAGAGNSSGAKRVSRDDQKDSSGSQYDEEKEKDNADLLHRGGILGDLPSLGTTKKSPSINRSLVDRDVNRALKFGNSPGQGQGPGQSSLDMDMRADGKDAVVGSGKKKKKREKYVPPPDMPVAYLCELTKKPMSEPVKTIYGNLYEKRAILSWINQQGHIDPLTGAPLSENDLKPMDDLANEIREYILERSKGHGREDAGRGDRDREDANSGGGSGWNSTAAEAGPGSSPGSGAVSGYSLSGKKKNPVTTNDDLYDF
jgi:U-box domain